MKLVSIFTLIFLSLSVSFSQNSLGAGTRLKLGDKNYYSGNLTYQTNVFYTKPSFEIIGINSTNTSNDSLKFSLGYTFEVGLSFFNFTKEDIYLPNHPNWVTDTVGYRI